jgi:hypothetical protein
MVFGGTHTWRLADGNCCRIVASSGTMFAIGYVADFFPSPIDAIINVIGGFCPYC